MRMRIRFPEDAKEIRQGGDRRRPVFTSIQD